MSSPVDEPTVADGGPAAATARVLIVCRDGRLTSQLTDLLRAGFPRGLLITQAIDLDDALVELHERGTTAILLGEVGPAHTQLAALAPLRATAPELPIIVVSELPEPHLGHQAVAAGAQDHAGVEELTAESLAQMVRFGLLRKRAEAQLVERASQDPLSGLPNRTAFLDRLTIALDRTRRTGAPIAVLLLDLDAFAGVNEAFGRAAGDQVLCAVAERLSAMLRPADAVARFGADEFALLVEDVAEDEDVAAIAERAVGSAQAPVPIDGAEVSITVSVGASLVRAGSADAEAVMREAVVALSRGSRPEVGIGTPDTG